MVKMKIIYTYKKELYELFFNEHNVDENVVNIIKNNYNKCYKYDKIDLNKNMDFDFINFKQYNCNTYQKTCPKKICTQKICPKKICTQKICTQKICTEKICPKESEKELMIGTNMKNCTYEFNDQVKEYIGKNTNYLKLLKKCKKYFKNNGYIIKKGDLYGGDYLLYLTNEKYTHSVYVVYFIKKEKTLRELIQILRLSCSIKKKVIIVLETDTIPLDITHSMVFIETYFYK
ncbi:tRNA-splicing endonuclease, putative [Hepatocystis sp. ex Piliocolobus tephrosceles]|nr:tRNA-splicing endonuclease, putative [Hepatocystis sp. ex Piliocolobus tephrosceles]